MSGQLRLLNRQKTRPVDVRLLRRIVLAFLAELPARANSPKGARAESLNRRDARGGHQILSAASATLSSSTEERAGVRSRISTQIDVLRDAFDLTLHLIDAVEMTRLNETHLRHAGSTDVLTFDYSAPDEPVTGEIFVCVDETLIQAARFRVIWPEELVRYVVHGVLHLRGYDDLKAVARRRMKKAEDTWVRELAHRFDLSKLARTATLRA